MPFLRMVARVLLVDAISALWTKLLTKSMTEDRSSSADVEESSPQTTNPSTSTPSNSSATKDSTAQSSQI